MRTYLFADTARHALDAQIDYLLARNPQAASALNDRVHAFIRATLCPFPRTSRLIPERDLWETWVPGTRLVLWYTFDDDTLTVVMVWHTAQDRS